MRRTWYGLAAAVLLGAAAPAPAAFTLVNFDTLPGGAAVPSGTVIDTQYQNIGVAFSGFFRTNTGQAVSPPNSVFFNDPGSPTAASSVLATFFVPGTVTRAVTDYVEFTPTDASEQNTQFLLIAYDRDGIELGRVQTNVESSGVYSPAEDPPVSLSAAGIYSVELTGFLTRSGNFGIEGDNFGFNTPTAADPASPTPLPPTLLALAVGAAGLAAVRRRVGRTRISA